MVLKQVEQGFSSFLAKFLIIFQSEASRKCCGTLNNHQKFVQKMNKTLGQPISGIGFWSQKPDFRDPVHRYYTHTSYTEFWLKIKATFNS